MTKDRDIYIPLVKEVGGFEEIDFLQTHTNKNIHEKCVNMIEEFWKIQKEAEPDRMDQDSNDNHKMEVVEEEEAKMDDI